MATKVVINLPVKDIERSIFFFENLGCHFNGDLTDERGACMIISESISVMLLQEEYFKTFTKKNISDTGTFAEVLISLDANSKQQIQDLIKNARQMGAHIYGEPEDRGWMYQHGLTDLDGHHWEFVFRDNELLPGPW